MKLLFDHNLSPRLAASLSDIYPDSDHVHMLGLGQADDKDIWEHARREGFIIVTKDADFSDLCMLRGFPPNIIWIRRGNCSTPVIERMLRHHYVDVEALEKDASLGVLTLF